MKLGIVGLGRMGANLVRRLLFAVADKAQLDQVKVGDKIRFMAVQNNGRMVVPQIQAAKRCVPKPRIARWNWRSV